MRITDVKMICVDCGEIYTVGECEPHVSGDGSIGCPGCGGLMKEVKMSEPIDTGGPAFPVTPTDRSGQIADTEMGLTMRDWFAGQALAGWSETHHRLAKGTFDYGEHEMARVAYRIADAMLQARNK